LHGIDYILGKSSGLYSSMDTSRIIRVGTRIYIIRMAAVSQGHATVCIRSNMTRPENDGLVLASILY